MSHGATDIVLAVGILIVATTYGVLLALLWRRLLRGVPAAEQKTAAPSVLETATKILAAIGTAVAICFSAYSIVHGNALHIRQTELERRRDEEATLRMTRASLEDGYDAALVFVTSWTRYKTKVGEDKNLEREIRAEHVAAWRPFEKNMKMAVAVEQSKGGSASVAVAIQDAYDTSAKLFDTLMDRESVPFMSEAAVNQSNEARAVKAAIAKAKSQIDVRLLRLYDDV